MADRPNFYLPKVNEATMEMQWCVYIFAQQQPQSTEGCVTLKWHGTLFGGLLAIFARYSLCVVFLPSELEIAVVELLYILIVLILIDQLNIVVWGHINGP